LTGAVTRSTKVTAMPSPTDVLTVFDTARYEHIPRKYAKIILSIKMLRTKRLNKLSICFSVNRVVSLFCLRVPEFQGSDFRVQMSLDIKITVEH
jgi:hypothetical protein